MWREIKIRVYKLLLNRGLTVWPNNLFLDHPAAKRLKGDSDDEDSNGSFPSNSMNNTSMPPMPPGPMPPFGMPMPGMPPMPPGHMGPGPMGPMGPMGGPMGPMPPMGKFKFGTKKKISCCLMVWLWCHHLFFSSPDPKGNTYLFTTTISA